MAEVEEVAAEVEAVEAVYGEDCSVLRRFPPHLHVHIKPRTADVSSQQFVEAIIGIQANSKYPDEPPVISIVDSKGLDDRRQNQLATSIRNKCVELSSCLMLVALCEEAVEKLSGMNHPDGNCALCMYPLLDEGDGSASLPFMQLMSCFHCFHCECIIRWYNWLQIQKEVDYVSTSGRDETIEENTGQCPVCRKGFLAKDIEHVPDLDGIHPDSNSSSTEVLEEEYLLQSYSEKIRRQKFEATLKLQQENSGLIDPKKHEVLLPGMFLPRSAAAPSTALDEETKDQESENAGMNLAAPSTTSDKETKVRRSENGGTNSGTLRNGSSNRPSTSKHRNTAARKHFHRGWNTGKHRRQWIQKENGAAS